MKRFDETLKRVNPVLLLAVLFAILPWAFPVWPMWNDVLIFGLFAIAFNLLLGQTGILSFGHAAYFALGAYGAAMFLVKPLGELRAPLWAGWLSIPVGIGFAGIVGLVIGVVALRRRGTYFAVITLVFCQMFYLLFGTNFYMMPPNKDPTGASDGVLGVLTPGILWWPGTGVGSWRTSQTFYYLCLVVVMVAVFAAWRISNSPFGEVLRGIRDDEIRVKMLGYNTDRYKLICFTLSAMFSGLAGSLYSIEIRYAGPEFFFWLASGEVIIMTLLGGMGTFFGPFFGAVFYIFLKDLVSAYTIHWMIFAGGLVMLITLLYRGKGVMDMAKWIAHRLYRTPEAS